MLTCVNCDGELAGSSLLYCSQACEQEASYIRYHRLVLADGRWKRPEIQETLRIRRVVVLNGGYPELNRSLSKRYREFILERDHHTCRVCGNPGGQVDHIHVRGINGNVNHPNNLQVLCTSCHREKTLGDIRLISHRDNPEVWQRLHAKSVALDRRIQAEPAERLSDDEHLWAASWRSIRAERARERQLAGETKAAPARRKPYLWLVK